MTGYHARQFTLPQGLLKKLTTLTPQKSLEAFFVSWLGISVLSLVFSFLWKTSFFWPAYLPLIFLMAGRQGSLLQLCHEASHTLLSKDRRQNLFLARAFAAMPLGLSLDGYIACHLAHHLNTGTPLDPPSDQEKYRVTDFSDGKLFWLFLKDLSGITALKIFFAYEEKGGAGKKGARVKELFGIALIQLVILTVCFRWNLTLYFLGWILPATTAHMFLMRIRGIAEHGLAGQLGIEPHTVEQGMLLTRSFLLSKRTRFISCVEKLLIGSLSVHYHHEHHLFPGVPFYHLEKLHRALSDQIAARNPLVYESGYFSAAFAPKTRHLIRVLTEVPA